MPNAYSRALKAHDDNNNEGIRLQKILAQAGFGSRRKCEQMITDGRVEVDGELVTELGTRVDPKKQHIRVDGSRVHLNPNHVTLALNKPKKVLSAMDDPKGRYTLADIIGDKYERVFHMGRLDYDSEGLILMTNDGELSQHVMHPKYEVEKTYIATIDGKIGGNVCRRLVTQGVQLDDGLVKLDHCAIIDANRDQTIVKVVLHSGKNRIVRRIFGAIGYPVRVWCAPRSGRSSSVTSSPAPTVCCPRSRSVPCRRRSGCDTSRHRRPCGRRKVLHFEGAGPPFRLRLPRYRRHVPRMRLVVPASGHRPRRRSGG